MARYEGLLAGLGNPGSKYEYTRHNLGFMLVDALIDRARSDGRLEELNGKKFDSLLWRACFCGCGGEWLLAKPQTFMNDSGRAIRPLLAWHELAPDQLIVAHDELDLPPGALRFKFGGGLAGHNGLASIARETGTKDFYRLRMGIGKAASREETLAWVLGRPGPQARRKIEAAIPFAVETFFIFNNLGAARATQFAHAALGRINAVLEAEAPDQSG